MRAVILAQRLSGPCISQPICLHARKNRELPIMSGHLGRSSDSIAKKGNLHSRHHQTAAYSLQLKDL